MSHSGGVVTLASGAFSLAAPVSLAQNALTVVATLPVLPPGRYVVDFSAPILVGASGETIDVTTIMSSGAATFSGQHSDTVGYTSAVGSGAIIKTVLSFEVVITTAGAIQIDAEMTGAATASTVLSTSHTQGYASVAGGTWTKVG